MNMPTSPLLAVVLLIQAPILGFGQSHAPSVRPSEAVHADTGSRAAADPGAPAAFAPELQPYAAIGSELARNSRLREAGLSQVQRDAFLAGVRAALDGTPYPFDESAARLFAEMSRRISTVEAELRARKYAEPGGIEAYMKATCEKLKLKRSDSGLAYGILGGGGTIRPGPDDTVVFSLSATSDDEETALPQLTQERLRARVTDLMPGLAEGVQMMTVDARAMLVVPPELSFGEGAWPDGIVRGTPVILIVTLHEIVSPPVDF